MAANEIGQVSGSLLQAKAPSLPVRFPPIPADERPKVNARIVTTNSLSDVLRQGREQRGATGW